jgi:hypothetical protein
MMRGFKSKGGEWAGPQKHIIYYGGHAHSQNIRNILSKIGFTEYHFKRGTVNNIDAVILEGYDYYHDFFDR